MDPTPIAQQTKNMDATKDVEGAVERAVETPVQATNVGTSTSQNKKKLAAFGFVALVVVVAVSLAVGLTVGRDGRDDLPSAPAFEVNLQKIGPETLSPYESCEEFRMDLLEAGKYLANSRIDANARIYYHNEYRPRGCASCQFGAPEVLGSDSQESEGFTTTSDSSSNTRDSAQPLPDESGEDSFGTNNQVEGVDEADVVKSNGVHVFTAYGNEIVTVDAQSVSILSRTVVPVLSVDNGVVDFDTTVTQSSNGRLYGNGYDCSSSVAALLLSGDRLVAIASGHCYFYGPYDDLIGETMLSDSTSTTVFVYDVSSVPTDGVSPLPLLGMKTVQGYYKAARSIQDAVHIVTTSYVDTYRPFTRNLDRYNSAIYNDDLLENEYRTRAHELASDWLGNFTDALLDDIKAVTNDDTCASVFRVATLQSSDNGDADAQQLEFTGNGIIDSLSLITSFNMSADVSTNFKVNSTATLLPTAAWTVYSSQERLVLAANGWNENANGEWREETFLLAYGLYGASSTAQSYGHAPGRVLNQFSIDHNQKAGVDYVRIATTTSEEWGLVSENPREWGQVTESESHVTVLRLPSDGDQERNMTVVGQVSGIGRTERIYSVRFLGDRGFVVTFRQVDPFYTLDLSEPTNPRVVGELKIPGFSNYLHPVGNDLILGVGQDADNTGRVQGLQISLFNVSNFSDPQRIHNYVAETSNSAYSNSEAQYDHRAFRYLEETKVLILPVQIYSYHPDVESFDGFYVYEVDQVTGIFPRFSIEHANNDQIRNGCWSRSGYLAARSLVFSGDVMTLKGHTILSHDLQTNLTNGPPVNLDATLPNSQCTRRYFSQS